MSIVNYTQSLTEAEHFQRSGFFPQKKRNADVLSNPWETP